MTHKWSIFMINIMIGRKKIGLIIVVILSYGLNSCIFQYFEDEPADYILSCVLCGLRLRIYRPRNWMLTPQKHIMAPAMACM